MKHFNGDNPPIESFLPSLRPIWPALSACTSVGKLTVGAIMAQNPGSPLVLSKVHREAVTRLTPDNPELLDVGSVRQWLDGSLRHNGQVTRVKDGKVTRYAVTVQGVMAQPVRGYVFATCAAHNILPGDLLGRELGVHGRANVQRARLMAMWFLRDTKPEARTTDELARFTGTYKTGRELPVTLQKSGLLELGPGMSARSQSYLAKNINKALTARAIERMRAVVAAFREKRRLSLDEVVAVLERHQAQHDTTDEPLTTRQLRLKAVEHLTVLKETGRITLEARKRYLNIDMTPEQQALVNRFVTGMLCIAAGNNVSRYESTNHLNRALRGGEDLRYMFQAELAARSPCLHAEVRGDF